MPFYFAYAEDMDPDVLSKLCGRPLAPACVARIASHTVNFRSSLPDTDAGGATLDPASDDTVTGALFIVEVRDLDALDISYGLPGNVLVKVGQIGQVICDLRGQASFRLADGTVVKQGDRVQAAFFQARDPAARLLPPRAETIRAIALGALKAGIPFPYVSSLVNEQHSSAVIRIDSLKPDQVDPTGKAVRIIYWIAPPRYAVYGTNDGVKCLYAENPDLAQAQRANMAALNGTRSSINSLLDGWQKDSSKKDIVHRYNGPVAAALVMCFEGDAAGALLALNRIRDDILSARLSIGRMWYLVAASGAAAFIVLGLIVFRKWGLDWWPFDRMIVPLLVASKVGAIGAFFSIATGLRNRTVRTDLYWGDNMIDAALRIAIGAIGAAILVTMLQSNLVGNPLDLSGLTDAKVGDPKAGDATSHWRVMLVVAFIAGFLERLVPDMLDRAGAPHPGSSTETLVGSNTERAAPGPRRRSTDGVA